MSTTNQIKGDFSCNNCGFDCGRKLPVRGFKNALAFDAWFEGFGWSSAGGRPLCGACKALPPSSGVRRAEPSKPLDVLADVAKRLEAFGSTRIALRTLFLDGESVVMANASDALVLCQVVRGSERVAPAENVAKGASPASIASMVLARVAKGGRHAA